MTRDPRVDPRPGDEAAGRDKPVRRVEKLFTDATGAPWMIYSERRCVSVKTWGWWFKRTGARVLHAGE